MKLKINNIEFTQYNNLVVNLDYNSVASTFSFGMRFNPDNELHKQICKPFSYPTVTIEQDGQLLLTGTLLSPSFTSASEAGYVGMSGYAKPGVLEDCPIPHECYPLDSNGLSLKNIAEKILKPFGIGLVIDARVADRVNKKYTKLTARDTQSAKQYLSELASQRHIILTHDEKGSLVMTEANATQAPIYDFVKGMPGVKFEMPCNGQGMHSHIDVQRQKNKKHPGGGTGAMDNPFVKAYRPTAYKQSAGDAVNTDLVTRNMLADELRNIPLTVELDRWMINGNIIRPNSIISVLNPELYLYKKTNFFIERIDYAGNTEKQVCTLSCVLPEVYNGQKPKNIFE